MTNVSITIRLSPGDLDLIDGVVEKGQFTNRSDAIRDSIRTHLRRMGGDRGEDRGDRPKKGESPRGEKAEKKLELHERVLRDAFGSD